MTQTGSRLTAGICVDVFLHDVPRLPEGKVLGRLVSLLSEANACKILERLRRASQLPNEQLGLRLCTDAGHGHVAGLQVDHEHPLLRTVVYFRAPVDEVTSYLQRGTVAKCDFHDIRCSSRRAGSL